MLGKELKIALGVGIAMILICLLVVLIQSNKAQDDVKVNVYKLTAVEGEEDKHVYKACSISTEDALKINKEYKRIQALRDLNALQGQSINGDYKVVIGEEFVAFDNSADNMIYIGKENKIYKFSSEIYELVVNTCA